MTAPRLDRSLTLRDTRKLAYAEWGDANGRPVVFFSGTPSGRLTHPPDPAAFDGLAVRWITMDRPGYGGSSPQKRRTLLGWAEDVGELADHLALNEFSIVGLSGGGPHALACAYAHSTRVRRVAVVSGVGIVTDEELRKLHPERRLGALLSRRAPWLVKPLMRLVGDPRNVGRHYAKVVAQCPTDHAILERPEIRQMLMANWAEANRLGLDGYAGDGWVFARPWGFEPAQIRTAVRFWHGSSDESVPLTMAERLAREIPGATLEVVPAAGHFLFFDRFREIAGWAAGGEDQPPFPAV